MRQASMVMALFTGVAGAGALVVTAANGGGTLGFLIGAVLLAYAFVRYRLAQRR